MPVGTHTYFRCWIKENMQSTEKFWDLPWGSLFPYMCHEIWKDRNTCVFKNQNPSPFRVICFRAREKVKEFLAATGSVSLNNDPLPFAHSKDFLMIHVDVSFVGNMEVAGIGGVIRKDGGHWVWGFGKKTFAKNALEAELLAILEALVLIEKHKLPKAIVYSDCMDATNLLTGGQPDLYSNLINMCRQWMTKRPDIQLKHCSRKYNKVADLLAKDCRNMDGNSIVTRIFPLPPSYCLEQLLSDCNMFDFI
ncbi:uncharacterized protein LOC130591451 [Beta vulgaris subsp. vulgaris]|uniref:uncharacterized protein LOC130591451 n=1 Tax=Beta vulgaris subsp. vulgaris TaxID=3555 RepID=UPI00254823BE|nr:uncharacterized protein LOC130591451 [Beta vulgaris subsp. vulgaris]